MGHVTISLRADPDGSVRVDATVGIASWSQVVTAPVFAGLREQMAGALPEFDDGWRPFADPVALAGLGARLRDTFFPTFYGELLRELTQRDGRLLLVSSSAECLNQPWELLPGLDGSFLVADGRVAIRRSTRESMPACHVAAVPARSSMACLMTSDFSNFSRAAACLPSLRSIEAS